MNDIITAATKLCAELTATYDESHDLNHHLSVDKNVCAILAKETNHLYLTMYTRVAALLHDVVDHKYPETYETNAAALEGFLTDNFDEEDACAIRWIIANISYSKEVKSGRPRHSNQLITDARDIVSDADKIEAIGEVGIVRCAAFTRAKNSTLTEKQLIAEVVKHCNEKLLRLRDEFVVTAEGRRLAGPGHAYIEGFVLGCKMSGFA